MWAQLLGKHTQREPNTLETRNETGVKEYFPKSKADFYLGVCIFGGRGLGKSTHANAESEERLSFPRTKTTNPSLLHSILHVAMGNPLFYFIFIDFLETRRGRILIGCHE